MNAAAVRVKFICRLGYGESLPKEEEFAGDVPVYGSNGQYATTAARNTDAPAIVLGRKGSYGKVNWASEGCFASDTTFFVDERLTTTNLRWLYWGLQALGLDEGSQEAAVPGLNRESVYEERILFPSSAHQATIANYLDCETARIDGLIVEKERMLALLDEKRAALVSHAVTRGLNPDVPLKPSGQEWLSEIPAHWDICQLKRSWASSDYGLSESIRDEGDIAVLRMSCIVDGRVDVSKSGMIAEVDGHFLLRRDDLLFNRTNSLDQIAKVGLVDFDPAEPLTFASYLVRIRTNHLATSKYLVALLNAPLFLEFARKNAIPAIGQANLSPTRYGEIRIPLPPEAEQDEIVTFLEQDAETSTPVREQIRRAINLLKERRSALIYAAVTGQIPLEEMKS
ncbi:restriction endonuclease subunit S [Pseudomonas mosselii]|uniref:restriction endonuclease subunit S n=1 Tax=Pseudomonas mosselii TaxID=78327 RepID=UPI00244C2FEB|nr:restriction endonuclease subunit S [Pseudomonas mosselii]MDH0629548.1 restriction endonuclease subunit S [Pseudomonas mosselii]MDH0680472.1 restriction endonuclease subunit S [Pseudomonas mosselii]MDH0927058.1 restriction endonuclease subunit S [Pseudomonas mosselii]MDH1136311.1 restriction endonuclease subunit S [Pseudomonas mosselii]MDH1141156.1 restriction endonuclease subunit S [Pseudomonas mosselii]